jgi:hypothetical protein
MLVSSVPSVSQAVVEVVVGAVVLLVLPAVPPKRQLFLPLLLFSFSPISHQQVEAEVPLMVLLQKQQVLQVFEILRLELPRASR